MGQLKTQVAAVSIDMGMERTNAKKSGEMPTNRAECGFSAQSNPLVERGI